MTDEEKYFLYGINGEPDHNTDNVFCWCAPKIINDGTIVLHRTILEIIESALNSSATRQGGG